MDGKKNDKKLVNQNTMMCGTLNCITSQYRVHYRNGCFTISQRFARVVKRGWIHCTSKADRNILEVYIKHLAHNGANDYAKIVAEELSEFTRNSLPLKTLARQCIMQYVMWKDVKHLRFFRYPQP